MNARWSLIAGVVLVSGCTRLNPGFLELGAGDGGSDDGVADDSAGASDGGSASEATGDGDGASGDGDGSSATGDGDGTSASGDGDGTSGDGDGDGVGCETLVFGEGSAADVMFVTGDAQLDEDAPEQSQGESEAIEVDGGAPSRKTALIRFDLTALPPGAAIEHAKLKIVTNGAVGSAGNPGDLFFTRIVREPWSENAATWLDSSAVMAWSVPGCVAAPCLDPAVLDSFEPSSQNATFETDATPAVVEWHADPYSNYGIAIVTEAANGADFHSSESVVIDSRPRLEVTFCGG